MTYLKHILLHNYFVLLISLNRLFFGVLKSPLVLLNAVLSRLVPLSEADRCRMAARANVRQAKNELRNPDTRSKVFLSYFLVQLGEHIGVDQNSVRRIMLTIKRHSETPSFTLSLKRVYFYLRCLHAETLEEHIDMIDMLGFNIKGKFIYKYGTVSYDQIKSIPMADLRIPDIIDSFDLKASMCYQD